MRPLLLLTSAMGCGLAAHAQEPLKTIMICDLLREPSQYNGKTIAVRGEYFVGGHGLYLRGPDCDGILATKGYRWPSLIWISRNETEFVSRGLSSDRALRAEIEIGAARQRKRQGRGSRSAAEKVTLTYVGLFETRENFDSEVGRDRYGRRVANGFGAGNIAPGQLFVDSVKDILVEFVIGTPVK